MQGDLAQVDGCTGKTVNAYRASLHSFFKWLVREERWSGNPVQSVARVDEEEPTRVRRALRADELRRLLATVPYHRAVVYLVAVTTGLRRSELAGLRVSDLDQAGIPREVGGRVVDFHALRVTYATELGRSGVPLVLTQQLMRHKKPELTANVYSRFELSEKSEAVSRIDFGDGLDLGPGLPEGPANPAEDTAA